MAYEVVVRGLRRPSDDLGTLHIDTVPCAVSTSRCASCCIRQYLREVAMAAQARLQVVVAHPDDETFGCGSVLLHAAAAGAATAVVCATRGEEGGTTDDLGEVREKELRAAAELLGVSRVDLLGFADSGISGEAGPGTLVAAPFPDVVAAVTAAVADFRPDVLVTLDASDSHRDHARIRDAALQAACAVRVPRVYLACLQIGRAACRARV